MLTGMYVQLIHFYDLDTKGYRGTYRISQIGLEQAPKRWKYLESLDMEEVYNDATKTRLCALAQGPIPPCESNFGVEMAKIRTFLDLYLEVDLNASSIWSGTKWTC